MSTPEKTPPPAADASRRSAKGYVMCSGGSVTIGRRRIARGERIDRSEFDKLPPNVQRRFLPT